VYEIIKYTAKYVELTNTEKEIFLNKLCTINLSSGDLDKNVQLISDKGLIDIKKMVQYLSDSIIISNKHKLNTGVLNRADVVSKVYSYVENFVQTHLIKALWGVISNQSCNFYVSKQYFKEQIGEFDIYNPKQSEEYKINSILKINQKTVNTSGNITHTKPHFIENVNKQEVNYRENMVVENVNKQEVNYRENMVVENNINIDKVFLVCIDPLDIKEFYTNHIKETEKAYGTVQNAHQNNFKYTDYNAKADAGVRLTKLSDKHIQKTINKSPKRFVSRLKNVSFKTKKRIEMPKRENYKRSFLNITNNIEEINSGVSKELENYLSLTDNAKLLKLINNVISDTDNAKLLKLINNVISDINSDKIESIEKQMESVNRSNYLNLDGIVGITNQQKLKNVTDEPKGSVKNNMEQAQTSFVLMKKNYNTLINKLKNVKTNNKKRVNTLKPVSMKPLKTINPVIKSQKYLYKKVNIYTKTFKLKCKHLSFYKRWRFKTGKAHDNIWLNPVTTEEYKIALQRTNILNDFYNDISNVINLYDVTENSLKRDLLGYLQNLFDNKYILSESVNEFAIISDIFKVNVNSLEESSINNIRETIESLLINTVNEYKSRYIDELTKAKYELAIESRISFKALLDFILFIEQIIYINKSHFAANRAVTVIERMIKILDEWLNEAPPTEIPNDYLYLLRWFKWFAEGEKNRHLNDVELNGLIVIEKLKDQMINYFESRWGKRVVEYGPDGMYIYSKDYSYIDRIRGKKHGTNKMLVDKNTMKEDYGISEKDLPFNVEGDE
jgi:hypothetical protein